MLVALHTELNFAIQRRKLACLFAPRDRASLPAGHFLHMSLPFAAALSGLTENSAS